MIGIMVIYKSIIQLVAFIFMIYILPAGLIWLEIVPFKYRFYLLSAAAVVLLIYLAGRRYSFRELGIGLARIKESIFWNAVISVLFLLLLAFMLKMNLFTKRQLPGWEFFPAYVLILVPVQELFFRSALFSIMDRFFIRSPYLKVAVSSLLFCYVHIIYNNIPALVATLFIGLLWGIVYHRCPNFWGVALSHSIVGIAAISNGFI